VCGVGPLEQTGLQVCCEYLWNQALLADSVHARPSTQDQAVQAGCSEQVLVPQLLGGSAIYTTPAKPVACDSVKPGQIQSDPVRSGQFWLALQWTVTLQTPRPCPGMCPAGS
jgi:hypothetical protein